MCFSQLRLILNLMIEFRVSAGWYSRQPPKWPPMTLPPDMHALCNYCPSRVGRIYSLISNKQNVTKALKCHFKWCHRKIVISAFSLSPSSPQNSHCWEIKPNYHVVRSLMEMPMWQATDVSMNTQGGPEAATSHVSELGGRASLLQMTLALHNALTAALWRTLSQRHPAQLCPDFDHRNCDSINVCFKPINLNI